MDIFEKYDKYIKQVKAGYLRGITYPEAMEILRYCEKRLNRNIPLNFSCNKCVIDLVILFNNLRNENK